MNRSDNQFARIAAIVGDDEELGFEDCRFKYCEYLETSLQLPCDVTGIEDFRWEEFYVLGPGDPDEYKSLRKVRPSYKDKFELLEIEIDASSEWMLFHCEDIAGYVRRKSDGKEFYLGLSEIKAVDKKSKNYQILDDYSVWFANSL